MLKHWRLVLSRVGLVWGLVLAICVVCILGAATFIVDLQHSQRELQARSELRRLAVASAALWQEKGAVTGDDTWRAMPEGFPRTDPWASPYRISGVGEGLICSSAGIDRRFGSQDDLQIRMLQVLVELRSKVKEPSAGELSTADKGTVSGR